MIFRVLIGERKASWLIGAVGIVLLAAWLLKTGPSSTAELKAGSPQDRLSQETQQRRGLRSSNLASEETEISDPKIDGIVAELQKLESSRTTFCREHEDHDTVYFDFLVEAPDNEETRHILSLCASAKGLTSDWFTGRRVAWNSRLQDDFLFTGDCAYYQVSVSYSKTTGKGDYSVLGISKGNLSYLPNGLPAASNGSYRTVFVGRAFALDERWRFSHLITFDESE